MINFLMGLLVVIGAVIVVLGIMFFAGIAVILGISLGFLLKFFIGLFVLVFIIWLIGKLVRGGFSNKSAPPQA